MNGTSKFPVTSHTYSSSCPSLQTAGRPFNPLSSHPIIAARKLFFERLLAACRNFQDCRVYTDDLIETWWKAVTVFTLQSGIDGHPAAYIANSIEQYALSSSFFITPSIAAIKFPLSGTNSNTRGGRSQCLKAKKF